MEKVDVIIPLGKGSKHNNMELRFALRSLEKNFPDLGRVILVTDHAPSWISKDVVVVPCADELKHNKDGNIIRKVIKAIKELDLTEKLFVFMADDNVFLKPLQVHEIGYYHLGNLKDKKFDDANAWHRKLSNSYMKLLDEGKETLNWESHCPVAFAGAWFLRTYEEMYPDFDLEGEGYTIYTMYLNNFIPVEYDYVEKHKFAIERKEIDLDKVFAKDFKFISYNDTGFTQDLKIRLATIFPEKSRFENDVFTLPIVPEQKYISVNAFLGLYDDVREEFTQNNVKHYHYLQSLKGRLLRAEKESNIKDHPGVKKTLQTIEWFLYQIAKDITLADFLKYSKDEEVL